MGIVSRNVSSNQVDLKVPKFHFVRDYRGDIDGAKVAGWAFSLLGFLTLLAILVFSFVVWYRHITLPPPKVVTKVVHESALTAAQNAYITQCKNSTVDNGDGAQGGVPDVHGATWSCVWPKN